MAKHPELAVGVANQLGLKLKVVGSGAMLEGLTEMAGKSVEFLGAVDDQQLVELYKNARALLYPVEDEDFGMVPVEAMSFGTPVIAHRSGGPKETIKENKNGIFFDDLNAEALGLAVKSFEKNFVYDIKEIHNSTKQYSFASFEKKINKLIFA